MLLPDQVKQDWNLKFVLENDLVTLPDPNRIADPKQVAFWVNCHDHKGNSIFLSDCIY